MLLLVVFVLFCFVVGLGVFICLWVMCFKGWFFSFFPSFTCPLILLLSFIGLYRFSSSSFFLLLLSSVDELWCLLCEKGLKKITCTRTENYACLICVEIIFINVFVVGLVCFLFLLFFRWFVSMGEMAKWRRLWTGIKRVQMYEWTNEWKFIYSA